MPEHFFPVAFAFVDCCHEVFREDKKQLISASQFAKTPKTFGAMLLHCVCCKVLVRGNWFLSRAFGHSDLLKAWTLWLHCSQQITANQMREEGAKTMSRARA
jgi:hypothetical protein